MVLTVVRNMRRAVNILFALSLFLVIYGCKEDEKTYVESPSDPETTPTVVSTNVKTLISDSGVTKYRITAKYWAIYQEAKKPYWRFPEGLYLEQFDTVFATVASIKCDSATYFKTDEIWRLDGHVTILNSKNEVILTPQLFWNQAIKKVYSDSFIHIEKSDRIIEGFGFESNERMTVYTLRKTSGIFPVESFTSRRDSINDSTAVDAQPNDTLKNPSKTKELKNGR